MSKKRDFILRYLYIIKKLRTTQFATFQEINNYLENQFEWNWKVPISIFIGVFEELGWDLWDILELQNLS